MAGQDLIDLVKQTLAQGRNVVLGDTDHSSPEPRRVVGDSALLAAIHDSGGTLILEGPQEMNRTLGRFYDGSLSRSDMVEHMRRAISYHKDDPQAAASYVQTFVDTLEHAKAQNVRIYYPEKNTIYDTFRNDPDMKKTFKLITGDVSSNACSPIQINYILARLTPHEKEEVQKLMPLLEQRSDTQENEKIIQGIESQPGPYVVLYGDAHRSHLAQGLNAVSISIVPSENTPLSMNKSLPDYVYYADTGHMVNVPQSGAERAQFMTREAAKAGAFYSFDPAQAKHCIDVLPDDVRNRPVPPTFSNLTDFSTLKVRGKGF